MGEIERILQLAKDGKITKEDAVRLLGAISGSLKKLPESTWERLFQLMSEGMDPTALAQVLEAGDEKDNKREKSYSYSTGDTGDFSDFRNMGDQMRNMFRRKGSSDTKGGARLLKIEVDSASGDEVRVNIPIGLATFALKLIPKEAQRAMTEQGLDMSALQEMLRGDQLPDGNFVDISTAAGDEIRISIS